MLPVRCLTHLEIVLCYRYLNIYVGTPDVEESFNVTRPVSPHEVLIFVSVRGSLFDLSNALDNCCT